MTSFKQIKFLNSANINDNNVEAHLFSNKTISKIHQGLDQPSKGKEALQWEKICLLEDRFVQAVEIEKERENS
tara:strand:- start:125 stop:343 length:219 start_codon:yes stop_codon:yes gene_type:complete